MQVNNVRIYLDSSSFFPGNFFDSRKFFGFFAGLFAFLLGKPGSTDPDPTRSRPEVARQAPSPTRNTEQLLPVYSSRHSWLLEQVPAAAKKSEQLFALTGSWNSYCTWKKDNYLFDL
jgi:hypothetical protein